MDEDNDGAGIGSQMAWEELLSTVVCQACGSTEMEDLDGSVQCAVCHSVLQMGSLQEVQEYDDRSRNLRGPMRRVTVGPKSSLSRGRKERRLQRRLALIDTWAMSHERVTCYVHCLQHLLTLQLQALQTLFAVGPQASTVARRLWIALVARSGVLETGWLKQLHLRYAPHRAPREVKEDEVGEAAAAGVKPPRNTAGMQFHISAAMQSKLRPGHTLVVAWLAAFYCRSSLPPWELMAAALSGTVPYLDLRSRTQHICDTYRHPAQGFLLHNIGLLEPPSPVQLTHMAARLASELQLPLPPTNFAGVITRMAAALGLPLPVAAVALDLARVHLCGTPHLELHLQQVRKTGSSRSGCQPYGPLVGCLLVALKLCYGLGGGVPLQTRAGRSDAADSCEGAAAARSPPSEEEPQLMSGCRGNRENRSAATLQPQSLPPPPDWGVWCADVMREWGAPCDFEPEGWQVHSPQLSVYAEHVRFCRTTLAGAHSAPPALAGFQDLCDGLLPATESGCTKGVPPPAATQHPPEREEEDAAYALAHWRSKALPTDDAVYMRVLAVLAAYAWLDPHTLQESVIFLEGCMVAAEAEFK